MAGFWHADSDRDWSDEMHSDRRRQFQQRVPCAICRAPVWVETRGYSIFDKPFCDQCRRPLPTEKRATP